MPEPNARSDTAPVAIVTAAGRGIGAACAVGLARRGYRVALMSRSEDSVVLAKELGGIGLRGSVRIEADLKRLVEETVARFGRVDAVINNTSDPARAPLLDLADSVWHEELDLILLNVVRMARLVTPLMIGQGGGAIVNISAADAYEPDERFPIGSTYRAALGAWTKLYADAHAQYGIRMNCLLPGIILPVGHQLENDALRSRVPARRAGRFEEMARVAAFLLSDDASYITGQNLRADGGMTRSV